MNTIKLARENYQQCSTYQDSGTFGAENKGGEFSTWFARPNYFRFEAKFFAFFQVKKMYRHIVISSNDDGAYKIIDSVVQGTNKISHHESIRSALGGIAGLTMGAGMDVFSCLQGERSFLSNSDYKLMESEQGLENNYQQFRRKNEFGRNTDIWLDPLDLGLRKTVQEMLVPSTLGPRVAESENSQGHRITLECIYHDVLFNENIEVAFDK